MTHTFTPGEYTMRNGASATVYEVTEDGNLIGAYTNPDGHRRATYWRTDGRHWIPSKHGDYDLLPPVRKLYINIYSDGFCAGHDTPESARHGRSVSDTSFVACIEVELPAHAMKE